MNKLKSDFFNRPTLTVAYDLLGKILAVDNMKGRIVETEAYIGPVDKGSHAYNYNMTNRTRIMFGPPGHAYIYLIYGMYNCLNFVTEKEGEPCAVLIRAVEPVEGIDEMSVNRFSKKYNELSSYQKRNLTNGPGKLCMAMNITRDMNGFSLVNSNMAVFDPGEYEFEVMQTKRINIDYAEEAKDFLWRFYIKGNSYVSRPLQNN